MIIVAFKFTINALPAKQNKNRSPSGVEGSFWSTPTFTPRLRSGTELFRFVNLIPYFLSNADYSKTD